MGLDITLTLKENIVCPKCGEVVATKDLYDTDSGGRIWYDILEKIGYYVPYEQRTEENDWYGKDMVLTDEQLKEMHDFVRCHRADIFKGDSAYMAVASAMLNKQLLVINADW